MNTLGVAMSGDSAELATPIGPVTLPNMHSPLHSGATLTLGIRPSDIRLVGAAEAQTNGRVQLIEPLGDLTVLSLKVDETVLRMVLPESQAVGMKPGDLLPIAADLSKVHFFRGHDGSALSRQS
jgi:ABC-type sugar transport system ATPase subunit